MSFHVISWAVNQALPCKEKMVLLMLASRTNGDTGRCDPSHKRLAFDCGLSESSVKRAIAELAEKNLLRIETRMMDGVNLPNQYVLLSEGVGSHRPDPGVTVNPGVGSHRPTKQEELKQEAKQKKPSGFDPSEGRPENVSADVWEGFCKMRKAKRANLTERACQLIAKKLAGLSQEQADEVVDRSTSNSWTDVYAEKAVGAKQQPVSSTRPPLKEGQFYHPEWDAGQRVICHVDKHDPETGYPRSLF